MLTVFFSLEHNAIINKLVATKLLISVERDENSQKIPHVNITELAHGPSVNNTRHSLKRKRQHCLANLHPGSTSGFSADKLLLSSLTISLLDTGIQMKEAPKLQSF